VNVHVTLPVVLAVVAYYVFSAAAGAMLPPEEGKERTWYGFWFRLIQTLAANSHRLADEKLLPALAKEIAAEEEKPHIVHVPSIFDARPFVHGGEVSAGEPYIVGEATSEFPNFHFMINGRPATTKETRIMANKVETFFEKIGAWLKAKFKKLPSEEVQISSAVNYVAPFVEELDDLADPELAPVVNPIIDKIKVGLAALATTITDSSVAGKTNVVSIANSLASNAQALESAFQVKDTATQQKATGIIQLISGEISAIQSQLTTPAPSTTTQTA